MDLITNSIEDSTLNVVPYNNLEDININDTGIADNRFVSDASRQIIQGVNIMAEIDTTQLSQEHGSIRHDIAVESARLGSQMGSESCGIRAGQGDIRREQAVGFGNARYDIATNASNVRQEIGAEHCKTNDIIRQEGHANVMAVKDARHDIITGVLPAIETSADRVVDRLSELRGTVTDRFFDVGRDTQDIRAQVISAQQQVQAGFLAASKESELNSLKTQLDAAKNTQFLADKIAVDGEKTRGLISDLKFHDLNRGLVERNTALVTSENERDN